jgi:hypothetical protein
MMSLTGIPPGLESLKGARCRTAGPRRHAFFTTLYRIAAIARRAKHGRRRYGIACRDKYTMGSLHG